MAVQCAAVQREMVHAHMQAVLVTGQERLHCCLQGGWQGAQHGLPARCCHPSCSPASLQQWPTCDADGKHHGISLHALLLARGRVPHSQRRHVARGIRLQAAHQPAALPCADERCINHTNARPCQDACVQLMRHPQRHALALTCTLPPCRLMCSISGSKMSSLTAKSNSVSHVGSNIACSQMILCAKSHCPCHATTLFTQLNPPEPFAQHTSKSA